MTDLPQHPTTSQQPTDTCGATTVGMYGRLLGPCLHAPHPQGSLHLDSHGAEWLEYDHNTDQSGEPETTKNPQDAYYNGTHPMPRIPGAGNFKEAQ